MASALVSAESGAMKWFPVGRVENDIMGRWHDTPESRVPVDVRDCARGSMARLVRFFNALVQP